MDVTNRTIIILIGLAWIALAVFVILFAWGAPDQSIDKLGDFASYLNDHNNTGTQLVVTFGGLIFALLGVMLLILELAPPESGSVHVAQAGSGDVRIDTDEVQQRLEEELRAMPGLGDVQVAVSSRGGKAETRLDLYIAPDADLAAVTDAACRRARDVIEVRLGVELASPPQAKVHFRGQASSSAPASAPPAVTHNPFAPPAPMAPGTNASPSSESSRGTATESSPEDRPAGA